MRRIFSLLSGSFRGADVANGLGIPDVFDFAFALLLTAVDVPGPICIEAGPLDRVFRAV